MKYFLTLLVAQIFFLGAAFAESFTPNVMAPLAIGDVNNPSGAASQEAWQNFRTELQKMKSLGAFAVSTDVWWGVVEGVQDGKFQWQYYDKLSDEIIAAGLKWVPIMSFHQCGGNVGDTCNFPIPSWIWTKHVGESGVTDQNSLKYMSEEDHLSIETVSVWGTPYVIGDYTAFLQAFKLHFAKKAPYISEINISLGPAGELRYPSYNGHDPDAGYPSRGRLQSYSSLARLSFANFMKAKYGANTSNPSPPDGGLPSRAESFFSSGGPATQFGQDFFDWYNGSLLAHGRMLINSAIETFSGPDSPFRGMPIGAKIPGVHWHMSIDRYAEMAAGLIPTSQNDLFDDSRGHGYATILGLFRDLNSTPMASHVTLHFTCLEMDDGNGGASVGSMAKSLVFWVAQEAHRLGITIKGENAIGSAVADNHAWDNISNAVQWAGYQGITILRMDDIFQNSVGQNRFSQIARGQ